MVCSIRAASFEMTILKVCVVTAPLQPGVLALVPVTHAQTCLRAWAVLLGVLLLTRLT